MKPNCTPPHSAAFPPQEVTVFPLEEGSVMAGAQYTLVCNVSRSANLPAFSHLEVRWLDSDGSIITSGTAHTISGMSNTTATTLISTLTIPHLVTSQGGIYTCAANMTIPGVVTDHQIISSFPVRVASELYIAAGIARNEGYTSS